VLQLLFTANIILSSLILFTLIMVAILSSIKSIHTRATLRHISEDGMFYSHRRERFKSFVALTG
jgi:hypothetical protein